MVSWKEDRSKFPEKNPDGTNIIDLKSQKFVKIWQGPQHPGVTGNMSLELTVQGDEIMESKTHVGYLHRGFEKLMERRLYIQCFTIVPRVCVPEPDSNEYCLAAAAEELSGIEIPEKAKWLRTLTLEMARLANYLQWTGGQCGSLGMGTVGQWTMYLRDYVLDRFEELTGARVYHMYIIPGGVRSNLPEGFEQRMTEVLDEIETVMNTDIYNLMFNNAVFKTRTVGVGYIDPKIMEDYGVTGPNARAGGLIKDVRKDYPYLVYDQLDFETAHGKDSDIYTRAMVRRKDLLTSVNLIRQIMAKMPKDREIMAKMPNVLHWKVPKGQSYVRIEASRGEFGYFMTSDGTAYPRRVIVRGPSYTHAMSLFEKMLINANIADVAATMVSLHTCPPEIER